MSSVDQRVVEMKFNRGDFAAGVKQTLADLDNLRKGLQLKGASAGLENIGKSAKNFSLDGISSGVDSLVAKFSALQVAGVAALGTIVSKATSAGMQLTNSLALGPISAGFSDYNAKLTSVQTIMNATGESIQVVDGYFKELDTYADKTIYNLSDMTSAFAKFTNAGLGMDKSVPAIKGIANMTALAGQGAEAASIAMYNLSQSIAGGFLSRPDFKSLELANVATKEWKGHLIDAAVAAGGLKKNADGAYNIPGVKKAYTEASLFTEGLQEQWASAEILTKVLGDYGDTTTTIGKKAQAAAQNVKSLPMMMETIRAALGTQWTDTFELIFGNVTEATELFTGLTNTLSEVLGASGDARNAMLKDWKALGGRTAIIDAVKNAWNALVAVVKPIRDAFRELFPAKTGKDLADLSKRIRDFTEGLKIGGDTAQRIKSTFEGVFSIFKIITMVIGGAIKAFFGLFSTVSAGGGGFLAITATIGEFIRSIERFLSYTGAIDKFFTAIASMFLVFKPLISLVSDLFEALSKLATGDFSGFTAGIGEAFINLGKSVGEIRDKFINFTSGISKSLGDLAGFISNFATNAKNSGNEFVSSFASGLAAVIGFLSRFMADARGAVTDLIETFKSAGDSGKNFFASLGATSLSGILDLVDLIKSKFDSLKQSMDFGGTFSAFSAGASDASSAGGGALSTMGSAMTAVFDGLKGAISAISKGLGPLVTELGEFFATISGKIREYLEGLNMQDAVALLNTGFFIAFYLAAKKFFDNMSEVTKTISGTFDQLTNTLKSMQNAVRASIIMQIAVAVGLLVAALFILAKIDAKALGIAIAALGALMTELYFMMKKLDELDISSMVGAGLGMIALATAIVILAKAIGILGEMDPDVLIQGGIALQVMMLAVAGIAQAMSNLKGLVFAATGMLILAAALVALSGAVIVFSKLDPNTLIDGLIGMSVALLAIGFATRGIPPTLPLIAAGIGILAFSLVMIAGAIKLIGALSMEEIAKGLLAIVVVLGAMVAAMALASGAILGAAAIAIVAASMLVMVEALKQFIGVMERLAELPFSTILKSMGALAAIALGVSLAAILLIPAIPVFAALATVGLIAGAAMMAIGAGMSLFAGGLALLGTVGVAGVMTFLTALPLMIQQVGHAFRAVITVVRDSAGAIMDAAGALIVAFVREIAQRIPQIAQAGLDMLLGLLIAINSRIGLITIVAVSIAKNFLDALGLQLPSIIQSGLNFILSFVEGLAKAIRGEKKRTGEAGSDLAMAMIEGMISGLKSFIKMLPPQVEALARAGVVAFKKFLGINSPSTVFAGFGGDIVMGLINGIGKFMGGLGEKAKELGLRAINGIKSGIANAASAGSEFVSKIISGITSAAGSLGTKAQAIVIAAITVAKRSVGEAVDIGSDIVDGIARGISRGLSIVTDAAKNLAKSALNAAKKFLGIASPSKEFEKIGVFVNQGFAKGITGSSEQVQAALDMTKTLLSDAMKAATADVAAAEEKLKKLTTARDNDTKALARANAALAEAKKTKDPKDDERARDAIERITQSRNKNIEAIRATTLAIKESKNEYKAASGAYSELTVGLRDETMALHSLANMHASFTTQIEEANKKLEDAIKTRDDYNKTITDQYDNLPDINTDTTLTDYITDLQQQAVDTNLFAEALQQLRNLGLSDEMYKTLLAKGLDAMPFVQEIIKGGTESVEEINKAGSELGKAAKLLGETGSSALYQAGVDTAQGLVAGLQSQQGAIQAEINRLAAMMVEAMNLALEIKSPSRVFMKVGVFSAQGLAKGLKDSAPVVNAAAGDIGSSAVSAMQKSLAMLSNVVDMDMDLHPTITPILDLTNMRKEAVKMGAMLSTSPISVDAAYSSAANASLGYRNNKEASVVEPTPISEPSNITFVQNNTSPKALSQIDIYRQTENQLSRVKGALTGANQGRGS